MSDWTPGPPPPVGQVWLSVNGGRRGRYTVLGFAGGLKGQEHLVIPADDVDVPLAEAPDNIEAWQPFVRPRPWRP